MRRETQVVMNQNYPYIHVNAYQQRCTGISPVFKSRAVMCFKAVGEKCNLPCTVPSARVNAVFPRGVSSICRVNYWPAVIDLSVFTCIKVIRTMIMKGKQSKYTIILRIMMRTWFLSPTLIQPQAPASYGHIGPPVSPVQIDSLCCRYEYFHTNAVWWILM